MWMVEWQLHRQERLSPELQKRHRHLNAFGLSEMGYQKVYIKDVAFPDTIERPEKPTGQDFVLQSDYLADMKVFF